MSTVQSVSLTVTHLDVLHVAQQIKRDLEVLHDVYPSLLKLRRVLSLHDAITTFLINDAITRVAFAVEDPRQNHLILHELRYNISYTGSGDRIGLGGTTVRRVNTPPTARMTPYVTWSPTMLGLSVAQQQQVIEGTPWGLPGTSRFRGRYGDGTVIGRAVYSSGVLAAEAEEYRQS